MVRSTTASWAEEAKSMKRIRFWFVSLVTDLEINFEELRVYLLAFLYVWVTHYRYVLCALQPLCFLL